MFLYGNIHECLHSYKFQCKLIDQKYKLIIYYKVKMKDDESKFDYLGNSYLYNITVLKFVYSLNNLDIHLSLMQKKLLIQEPKS